MRCFSWGLICIVWAAGSISHAQTDINSRMEQLDLKTADLKDVIALFGEPLEYSWGRQTFTRENLPRVFAASYPNGLFFVFIGSRIEEIRHEGPTGYRFRGKLEVGSSLEEALEVLGKPQQVVTGQANNFEDGVLYQDTNGKAGEGYYSVPEQKIRVFFSGNKLAALYVTNPSDEKKEERRSGPVNSVAPYDDVRSKNLQQVRNLDVNLLGKLQFNGSTVWPQAPAGTDAFQVAAQRFLETGKNPGLGVRKLHQMGITGK